MFKSKKIFSIILSVIAILFTVCLVSYSAIGQAAHAETDNENYYSVNSADELEPRLLTTLSITLNGGNGKVWATVKNDFTLFPSTVVVIVQLYSSYSYCENYSEMNLVSENSTKDLDMGHTIVAEASTGGEQKYWIGRMRYKIDSKGWEERTVGALKYSGDGEYIGVL